MAKVLKNKYFLLAVSLVFVIVLSLFAPMLSAKAEVIYEKENPRLKTKIYEGETAGNGKYTPTLGYTETEDSYTLQTNAWNMWNSSDHIVIAYENYKVKYGDKGKLTVTATVDGLNGVDGTETHPTSSIGINVRDGDSADAAELFLHTRPEFVGAVYRGSKGSLTSYLTTTRIPPVYPVQIKLVKQGNAFQCSFKNADSDAWVTQPKVYIKMGEDLMIGIAAHSTNPNKEVVGTVRDLKITIEGPAGSKYEGDGDGGDDGPKEDLSKVPHPDSPLTDDILLRETFTDGSLVNGEASRDNTIWGEKGSAAEYAVIETVTEEDGKKNNVWHREFTTDYYYIGDPAWTDYSFESDFKYGENCNTSAENAFCMAVRAKTVEFNGYSHYYAKVSYGNKITLFKTVLSGSGQINGSGVSIGSCELNSSLFDGKWHNLKIDAFDNIITVYLDNEKVLEITDDFIPVRDPYVSEPTKLINSIGNVGISSEGTDIYLDNIIVRKLIDLKGGDWDNSIDGNWNEDIPDYIKNWAY